MENLLKNSSAPLSITSVTKDVIGAAELLENYFSVKKGIAFLHVITDAEKIYNVELNCIKKLLPSAEHETGYLNPTQIGEKLGGIPAQIVNKLLAQKGFQFKDDGNWRL